MIVDNGKVLSFNLVTNAKDDAKLLLSQL
jgi:hypothetical protein